MINWTSFKMDKIKLHLNSILCFCGMNSHFSHGVFQTSYLPPTYSAEIFHKNHFHFWTHEWLSSSSLARLCCAAGSEGPLRPLNAGSSRGHSGLERHFWDENINQQHFSRLRRCLWRDKSMCSLRSYCVTRRKWLFMWEIFCCGSIWCVIMLRQATQYLFCSSVDV